MHARPAALAAITALVLTGPAVIAAPAAVAATAAPAAATAGDLTTPGGFTGMSPTRVLDTRNAMFVPNGQQRPLNPDEYYTTPLVTFTSHMPPTTHPVVPADTTAVVVNVTATSPTADSYLTLSAAGHPGTVPATSSLNFKAGKTVSNLVTVAVLPGTTPAITVYNHAGTTDVVLDVVGYYRAGATDKYAPLTPSRLVDSRSDGGRLGWDGVRSVQVARPELGTADARAVILNVTATEGTADSFLAVYPTGTERPFVGSNVNFGAGKTVPNQVVVPVGADGKIDVYNHVGSVDVVVDLVGYYGPSGTGLFSALGTPVRAYDTRSSAAVEPGGTRTVPVVQGQVIGAALNVTATEPTTDGHLTVYPAAAARPDTSNLNFTAGLTVANSVTTRTDDGRVSIYNNDGYTHVIADLTGVFVAG
ncbi:hypothetical protein J5Y04_29895 [Kitasatospora sp. RG8]|uniref:hypothetical protein n=1 Tax=Kitasatospora sp. RG8 TaxID=2820815 RepID=UPI001ADF2C5C|nr:hypothetical protein [Kitasatospora sp. RG8]MBP0453724.1 hypothetical protein [Kitasatospora sp. RG8]